MYKSMYELLFNAITDALEALEKNDPQVAANFLRAAQAKAEELYLDAEGEEKETL